MTFAGKLADAYRETGATDALVERRMRPSDPLTRSAARFSLLNDMIVSRGDKSDWDLLHELHYKADGTPFAPHFYKTTLYGETIGVTVTGTPKGLLKERHVAFPKLKPKSGDNKLINTHRYHFLNQNFRVISRHVFDTRFRGISCGYRMLNLVARMEGLPFMEIQSSMSKFNHFAQKAGFRFVAPMNSNKFDKGVLFFLEHFDASPQDYEGVVAELSSKEGLEREKLLAACRHFYFHNSALERTGAKRHNGHSTIDLMSDRVLIKNLQQMTLASPMYGVFLNPDAGTPLPTEIPLTAFDSQPPTEKFHGL